MNTEFTIDPAYLSESIVAGIRSHNDTIELDIEGINVYQQNLDGKLIISNIENIKREGDLVECIKMEGSYGELLSPEFSEGKASIIIEWCGGESGLFKQVCYDINCGAINIEIINIK